MQPSPHGPRTGAAKQDLFNAHDFIRPGEQEEYAQTVTTLIRELRPDGTLEQTFTLEIIGATWRRRRCRLVEEAFGNIEDLNFDPMLDERTEKQQRSVDRARAQSHLILRRSIAELSKLKTTRELRRKCFPTRRPPPKLPPKLPNPSATPAKMTGRNAPCPCKSGNKFKRCRGKNAPPVLNRAASFARRAPKPVDPAPYDTNHT